MQIDKIMLLIIIGGGMLYLGLGVLYTRMLLDHWRWFAMNARGNELLCTLSTLAWPALFIIFITWRMVEFLFEPREKDWREDAEIKPSKPWPRS